MLRTDSGSSLDKGHVMFLLEWMLERTCDFGKDINITQQTVDDAGYSIGTPYYSLLVIVRHDFIETHHKAYSGAPVA